MLNAVSIKSIFLLHNNFLYFVIHYKIKVYQDKIYWVYRLSSGVSCLTELIRCLFRCSTLGPTEDGRAVVLPALSLVEALLAPCCSSLCRASLRSPWDPTHPRLPAPRHTGVRQVTRRWVAWLPAQALLLAWARLCTQAPCLSALSACAGRPHTSLTKHKLRGKLLMISRPCKSFWEHRLSLTHEAQSADLLLQTAESVLSESAPVSSLCLGLVTS